MSTTGPRGAVPWTWTDRVALMAVVNVNADSFSDPRADVDLDERTEVARHAVAAGAAMVDLGAQSAALGADLVDGQRQAELLVPLVERLVAEDVVVSVDTYDEVAAAAVLTAGAQVLNDFSGHPSRAIVEQVAEAGAWYVLTHNPVGPRRRQTDRDAFADVVGETIASLTGSLAQLEQWGLPPDRVVLDPGVDVGKTPAQTLALLRGRARVRAAFDQPLLWAISRKDVLGAITGRPPRQRDAATLALLGAIAEMYRCVARVHDVPACIDHLTTLAVLRGDRELDDRLLDDTLRREV